MYKQILSLLIVQLFFNLLAAMTYNCTQPPDFEGYDVNSCCRIPDINLGTVIEKCNKYIDSLKVANSEATGDGPPFAHVCYPECIYRETGSLVNGRIRMENVRKFLNNNINDRDKDIVPQIVRSFQACLSNIRQHMAAVGVSSYSQLKEGCSPLSSMVYSCVNAETFIHCPLKMWKNDRYCNIAREFAKQCNPLPHVPLPLL